MINGHELFLLVLLAGVSLQLYFAWRKTKMQSDGLRLSREEYTELIRSRRRAYWGCYLFGGIGLGSLVLGAEFVRAFALAALIVVILLIASDSR